MSSLTVTSKGQVTLKKDILEHLGVEPGQQISVEKLPDGRVEVRAAPSGDISAVFGMFKHKGAPVSIEQMNEAAKDGWAGLGKRK